MGLEITGADTGPYPRPVTLTLRCDEAVFGMFACLPQRFEHPDGFIAQYRAAMRAGWKDTHRNSRRVILCPECSGKKPT